MEFDGIITSRQNRTVVETVKLDDKSARDAQNAFRFDGVKLMCEAVKKGVSIRYMIFSESGAERVSERARALYGIKTDDVDCRKICVSDDVFEKISQEKAPEGVICVADRIEKIHKFAKVYGENLFQEAERGGILLLESVRDPVNVGAAVRSAAAMGVEMLVLSSDCADIYNSRTVRGAMGTLFTQKIVITDDLPAFIRSLKKDGRRVFAAALDDSARKLGSFEAVSGDCAVIGNEGHGLSAETVNACTSKVYIPMTPGVESLNANAAAAIFLWEICRKR